MREWNQFYCYRQQRPCVSARQQTAPLDNQEIPNKHSIKENITTVKMTLIEVEDDII